MNAKIRNIFKIYGQTIFRGDKKCRQYAVQAMLEIVLHLWPRTVLHTNIYCRCDFATGLAKDSQNRQ